MEERVEDGGDGCVGASGGCWWGCGRGLKGWGWDWGGGWWDLG